MTPQKQVWGKIETCVRTTHRQGENRESVCSQNCEHTDFLRKERSLRIE